MRTVRLLVVAVLVTCAPFAAVRANAQTRTLTVHIISARALGDVVAVSGAVGTCQFLTGTCAFTVNQGATVRLSAANGTSASSQPTAGRFSGTGPAAGCALSTCTFVMTAD